MHVLISVITDLPSSSQMMYLLSTSPLILSMLTSLPLKLASSVESKKISILTSCENWSKYSCATSSTFLDHVIFLVLMLLTEIIIVDIWHNLSGYNFLRFLSGFADSYKVLSEHSELVFLEFLQTFHSGVRSLGGQGPSPHSCLCVKLLNDVTSDFWTTIVCWGQPWQFNREFSDALNNWFAFRRSWTIWWRKWINLRKPFLGCLR